MKPNNLPNRKTLLQIVQRRLDRVYAARSGSDVGPANDPVRSTTASEVSDPDQDVLGRIVRQIMQELSSDKPQQRDESTNAVPVPLHDVAAYVDGTLDDPQKLRYITAVATTDPGLMMEIVAAIRSRAEAESVKLAPDPLAPDLRSRLIALQQPPRSAAVTATATTASLQSEPQPVPPLVRTAKTPPPAVAKFNWASIAWLTTAAVVFFAVGWWVRSGMNPNNDPIAKDRRTIDAPELVEPAESKDADNGPGRPIRQDPMLVDDPESDPSMQADVIPAPSIKSPAESNPNASTNVANAPAAGGGVAPRVALQSTPDDSVPPVSGRPNGESPGEVFRQPQSLIGRWSQIDGVLLRSDSSLTAADSSSSESTPASVVVGSAFELAGDGPGRTTKLQTLPLCRATATLAGGGELVLAADTELELTSGGTLNLLHGSIALLGLNENRIVRLGRSIANSVSLEGVAQQGQGGAGIVVRKTVTGMEVDVTGKPIKVNERSFADSRLKLEGPLLAVEPMEAAPERLPRWTRERVDRIEVGRNVLAQLSESTDVRATLMQTLASGAVRGDAAMILRVWLVAASGDQLLRLIGSPDPLIRETALQHLQTINPADPRHRQVWRRLQAGGNNARTFATVRSYFVDLWSGRRPSATRRDQLLRMLQVPDPATRATANYLLRSFYGPGPRFDLNASATARTRAVNAWRVVINRVDQR